MNTSSDNYLFTDLFFIDTDNGFIGGDGVARTASPPYGGLDSSGEYMIVNKIPGVIASNFELFGSSGGVYTFEGLPGMAVSLAVGLQQAITSEMIGIIASMATQATALTYHFGVPQFKVVVFDQANPATIYKANLGELLPNIPSPYGNISLPVINDLSLDISTAPQLKVVPGMSLASP